MNKKKQAVLVIDDEQDIYDLVARTLLGSEFDVLQALNGREGIQMAREHKPDMILLDIIMPNFNGFMTGKILKRNIETRDIPIIFLSGKKSRQDINAAIQAGGSDYIVKPFSPSDLLTRIRKTVTLKETLQAQKKKKGQEKQDEAVSEDHEPKIQVISESNIVRYGDVIVCSGLANSIVLKNCPIYRGVFANIVSDGVFKVVIDTNNIETIDGAGLALLVSVNEALKSYGGELRITYPNPKVNNQLSYVKMIELFRGYDTVQSAVDSFQETDTDAEKKAEHAALNICISCTFVNDPDARYCTYCGTNLIMGRGEKILEIMRSVISHRIVSEAQTNDTQEINRNRNIKAEEYDIPSEFNVELYEDNLVLKYKSTRTIRKFFKTNEQIGIQLPALYGRNIRLRPGMKLQLSGTQSGAFSTYETETKGMDEDNGFVFVHYSEDAKVILSQKNFSIAPSLPIQVTMINPSFGNTDAVKNGKILELSRVRMVVFSEEHIPENECMGANFALPDGHEISSPLVIAKKRRERYMYGIEFVMIDEKEKSRIIQYMYKRQIELAKS
ncbi:response regulator [bacterium]|nr:response regulator [bacterium]